MVRTELDRPEDVTVPCRICGQPLKTRFFWIYDRWLRASVHDKCRVQIDKGKSQHDVTERKIPERFRTFDPSLANPRALAAAQQFGPDSRQRTLVIMGVPGKGKSRIAWAVAGQWFDELYETSSVWRWIDCHVSFEQFVAEFDRHDIRRISQAQFALIDDLGSVDIYGQTRALLQAAIRSRIKSRRWTIITVDDLEFDRELFENIIKDSAVTVVLD